MVFLFISLVSTAIEPNRLARSIELITITQKAMMSYLLVAGHISLELIKYTPVYNEMKYLLLKSAEYNSKR